MIDTYNAQFEVTDTFGGESNYSWVRRQDVTIAQGTSDRAIVRRLKAFAGFTGLRCRVDNYGDMIQVTPTGRHAPLHTAFFTVIN